MPSDITKTGPVALRGLNRQNSNPSLEELPIGYFGKHSNRYVSPSEIPVGLQAAEVGYGNSQYDDAITSPNQFDEINEIRYNEQPWYDTLANGVAKMYGTFATTFLSSIIGIPYGIEEAIRQQRWSALWDNDVTQALGDADDWMEEHFTNYRSQKQQDSPWYDPSNLFSMNFIADDIIKNNGFMMGSVASMAVGSGEIGLLSKALGYVGDIGKIGKTTQNVVSSLFAATGEGMIEAKQGVKERNKAERLNVDNALTPQYNSLQMEDAEADEEYARTKGLDVKYDSAGRPMDMAYERYMQKKRDIQARRQELDNRKAAAYQQIEESGQEMGNTILLANQGLLTMGNLLQFSKGMTKSFDLARHAAQTSSKIAKPAFATVSRVSKNLADGYKIGGSKAAGRLWAGTKGFLTEGAEEMNQQFIQGASGAAFNEGDVNDYWKARLDPDAYRSTTESLYDFGTILDRGFRDSWGSIDQWEQFLVGGLTGAMGSYMPTKLFNQDKSKKIYDPRRYGEWQGGAVNEILDYNKQYNDLEGNVKDLNDILGQQDFPARVQRLAAHAYHEDNKTQAAENNDKKWWKDEDDKQTIHDIQSFLRAGRLGDLRAIYDQIGSEWSDEDIEGLKKATTREVTADEDKKKFDDAKDEEIAEIARQQDALQEQLDVMREDGSSDAAMGDISSRITALEAEKAKLNQEKDAYKGQRRFIGAFIGEDGEATMTNDEIREVMKHNSEALNAKIDSYLDSVAAVNEATGGNLSKDQEDNLAYLHNMGKEGIKRFDDIMAKNRKHLPKTFLLRTDKSPEQLAKEYAISDITFSKDDNTPEGYVKADTSLMDDKTFGNFFMREVMRGGSISPELGATPDGQYFRKKAKADKNLKDEEKIARRGEQYAMNMQNIVDAFFESYMKENGASEMDAGNAFKTLMQELTDASSLLNSSGQYYKTLAEYMANPEKVEEAKEKEEKKNASKSAEKQAVDKFGGKSAKEINQDISKAALETAKQEAQKSRDIRQKQAETKKGILDKAEEGGYSEASVDAALDAVDAMAANAEDVSDINLDNIADFVTPEQVEGASVDLDEIEDLAQQVSNLVAEGLNSWKEGQDKKDDIPDASTAVSFTEPDSTGHDSTTQMPSETAVPKTTPQKSDEWEQPLPVNRPTSGAISKMKEEVNGDNNTTSQNAPWRSTTRRYGRKQVAERKWSTTRVPYHELVSDKNSVLYKRSKAIWEYLNDDKVRAWDKVDTVGKDKLEAGKTVIHFMVKEFSNEIFGKPFEELSEKEKPQALVIFMLNDNGEVLADLPLAKFERGYDEDISKIKSPQLKELVLTQKMLFEAFENKRAQTGCSEAVADKTVNRAGAENLGLTFKTSHKPFVSKVSQILNGIVPFGNEINTLNDIIGDEDILLGISVTGETIATAKDKKKKSTAKPLSTANIGQAYILIPSPTGIPVPVPFYTKPFNAQTHSTTQLYRILGDALTNLVNSAGDKDTSSYKESIDVLEGLLQVRVQEGARRTVEVTKDNVTLHLQSLTNPEQKIDIAVPNTGNTADIVSGIINKLSGTPINISLQFINSKIGVKNGVSAPYNKVIGEIADANLPKNTAHTVNNAFLIRLATDTTVKRTEVKYQQSGVQTRTIGDRTIQINTDNFTATEIDPVTKEEIPITGDEEVNLLLAETKAAQQADKTKPFKITLDGEVRTYDPGQRKFVKSSGGTGVNAGQASLNQQKEERKNGTISDPQLAAIFGPTERDSDESTTIEDIVTNADNFEDLSREEKVQYMERAFKAQGDKKKDYQPHLDAFDAALGEDEANKHKPGYVSKAKSQFKSFWDLAELVFKRDKEAAKKKSEQPAKKPEMNILEYWDSLEVLGDTKEDIIKALRKAGYSEEEIQKAAEQKGKKGKTETQPTIKKAKTIEDINAEVGDIINRRNQEAWNAISDTLKLKMANEGVGIVLEYGGTKVTLDYRNFDDMKEKLKEANKYAKSGSLTVSEGPKYRRVTEAQKKADIQKERRWLQKNLPMFNTEDRLHFLQGLIEIPEEKSWAWGRFQKGIITLSDMAARGTLYHEAFHAVTQTLLSDDELNELYDAGRKQYNEESPALVEELLAEDFRRYVQQEETPIVGTIRKFFRKIMNAIRNLSGYRDPVQELFYRINNGEFKDSIPNEVRGDNAFYNRIRKDRLLPEDHPATIAIRRDFNKKNWKGKFSALGNQWTRFKNAWIAEGYTPVAEPRYNAYGNSSGYVFVGVRTNVDEDISKRENRKRKNKERVQRTQAVRGVQERIPWDRLDPEVQIRLLDDITKESYESMSVDEQEQWVDCRG